MDSIGIVYFAEGNRVGQREDNWAGVERGHQAHNIFGKCILKKKFEIRNSNIVNLLQKTAYSKRAETKKSSRFDILHDVHERS